MYILYITFLVVLMLYNKFVLICNRTNKPQMGSGSGYMANGMFADLYQYVPAYEAVICTYRD